GGGWGGVGGGRRRGGKPMGSGGGGHAGSEEEGEGQSQTTEGCVMHGKRRVRSAESERTILPPTPAGGPRFPQTTVAPAWRRAGAATRGPWGGTGLGRGGLRLSVRDLQLGS